MRVDPNLSSLLNIGIQGTEQALNAAVQQVATGQRVGVPSDDPGATVANLQSLAESANVDRYTKNGDAVLSQAQMADSALSDVVNELNQAITLGDSRSRRIDDKRKSGFHSNSGAERPFRGCLASEYNIQRRESILWYSDCDAGVCVRQRLTDGVLLSRK